MINLWLILVGCALSPVLWMAGSGMQPANPEVALAPFAVTGTESRELRAVADECLERLATGLAAKGVAVVRRPSLDEKTLARAKPARWAVLGQLDRAGNSIRTELRLMEVATGDEMRSFFNSSSDAKEIVALGTSAAERIALFVQEKRGAGSGALPR
jgi:TolB-like protein